MKVGHGAVEWVDKLHYHKIYFILNEKSFLWVEYRVCKFYCLVSRVISIEVDALLMLFSVAKYVALLAV